MAEVMQKVKTQLLSRGNYGIRGLALVFKKMNVAGGRRLTFDDFKWGLSDYGVQLTPEEMKAAFALFDTDGDHSVSYDEFLIGLRGGLNDARKVWVEKAFAIMDHDGSGTITVSDIKARYTVDKHPDVISGKITADQAYTDFLKNLTPNDTDTEVTKDEFLKYYADMSASVDTDEYWEVMMKSAWKLDVGARAAEEGKMKAVWNGKVIAESDKTVEVEGNQYFPPEAVHREFLKDSMHTSVCGWKGHCKYYTVVVDGQENKDAAWYYESPKPAAQQIANYVAFWKGVKVSP